MMFDWDQTQFDRNQTQWRSRLGPSALRPRFYVPALLAAVCGLLLVAGAAFFIPARSTDATASHTWQASDLQDAAYRHATIAVADAR
jgi:hypothetical protein